jgi:hypothetical protein
MVGPSCTNSLSSGFAEKLLASRHCSIHIPVHKESKGHKVIELVLDNSVYLVLDISITVNERVKDGMQETN